MKKIIFCKGLPASGKSTWSKQLIEKHPGRYKRISKDDLRVMFDNGKWSKANEKFILDVRDRLIFQALEEGYSVIIDDTNLHPKHEARIREIASGLAHIEIQDFTNVSVEECIKRDKQRQNYVGETVIRKMYRDFLQPKIEKPVYDYGLHDALICDLDGTLALMNGRDPYDASTCEQDLVNEPVREIIENSPLIKILVTGRKSTYREQTENWLHEHNIPFFLLIMRKEDDNRKDAIVKREIYEEYIKEKYNVRFVLDDRNQVVHMWRSLGLTVFQVADGDF